jgi:hypothetical protein
MAREGVACQHRRVGGERKAAGLHAVISASALLSIAKETRSVRQKFAERDCANAQRRQQHQILINPTRQR